MSTRNQATAAGVVALLCVLLGASPTKTRNETDYILRVTSEVEGKQVKFDGAVLFVCPGAELQTLALETPYEMKGSGLGVSAMFVTHNDAIIKVQLVGHQGDKQISSSMAAGRTIVAGDNLVVRDASSFITSLGR